MWRRLYYEKNSVGNAYHAWKGAEVYMEYILSMGIRLLQLPEAGF